MREKKVTSPTSAPKTAAAVPVGDEWQAVCLKCQATSIAPTQEAADAGLAQHNSDVHKF
jgi:hypothetical protein